MHNEIWFWKYTSGDLLPNQDLMTHLHSHPHPTSHVQLTTFM